MTKGSGISDADRAKIEKDDENEKEILLALLEKEKSHL
jgi:hypothetical protein